MLIENKLLKRSMSQNTLCSMETHLEHRYNETSHDGPSILFDLTYACNLECLGCDVDACLREELSAPLPNETSLCIRDVKGCAIPTLVEMPLDTIFPDTIEIAIMADPILTNESVSARERSYDR